MLVYIDTTGIIEYNIRIQLLAVVIGINVEQNVLARYLELPAPEYPSAIYFRKKGVGYQPASFVFP